MAPGQNALFVLFACFTPFSHSFFPANTRVVTQRIPRRTHASFDLTLGQASVELPPHRKSSSSSSNDTSGQNGSKKASKRRWKNVLIPRYPDKYLPNPPENRLATNALLISITSAIIVGFIAIIKLSGPGSWRYYLAGGICAATSHAIPVPVDVVKTRKQVDPTLYRKTFVEAAHRIVEQDGPGVLLAGLGPTVIGYLMEGAVKFGVYEVLKSPISSLVATAAALSRMSFLESKVFAYALCAAVSGLGASIMLCPMEAIRIRMVAEPDFAPNWVSCGVKMLTTEGVSGLFKGMPPMIFKQVPYTVTKNVSFDMLTRSAYTSLRGFGVAMSSSVTLVVPIMAAVAASVLSCVSSQPGDMLLSLVNAHTGTRTTRDIVKDIRKTDRGLKGLFVGMKTRLLHVGIIVTLQLLIYDYVKRLCGIAATGL